MVDCRPGGDPSNPDPKAIPPECNGIDTTRKSDGTPNIYYSHFNSYLTLAKLTAAISPSHTVEAEIFATTNEFTAPFQLNPDAVTFGNYNVVGIASYSGKFLDRHLAVDALASGFRGWATVSARGVTLQDYVTGATRTYNPLTEPQVIWTNEHSLLDFENDPNTQAVCTDPPGATFPKCPELNRATGGLGWVGQPVDTRLYGRLILSALFDLVGSHTLALGSDYDMNSTSVDQRYSGQTLMRERFIPDPNNPTQGTTTYQDLVQFGSQNDPSNPNAYTVVDHLTSNTGTLDFGLFLSDTLRIARLVTVDAGLRWELNQLYGANSASPVISLADNFAPRFRVTVDPTRAGRAKIYGFWGRYFASIPQDLANQVFANAHTVVADHSQCVTANPLVAGDPSRCPVIPGSVIFLGQGQAGVAPDLQGQFSDVWGFGAAYEVLPDLTVQLHYADSQVVRAIDKMSLDGGQTFFIGNPGESKPAQVMVTDAFGNRTVQQINGVNATPDMLWPKPQRRYQALTLSVTKAATRNWELYGSYMLSRLTGNYHALFYDAGAQFDPTRNNEYRRHLVDHEQVRAAAGRSDPPHPPGHQLHVRSPRSSRRRLEADTSGSRDTRSTPWRPTPCTDRPQSYLLPRGSMGRTIPFWQLDLRAGVEYVVSAPYRISFFVECQNVTDRVAATSVSEDYTFQSDVAPIPGGTRADLASATTTSGTPIIKNPNFMNVTSWQDRRSFHFNLAISF